MYSFPHFTSPPCFSIPFSLHRPSPEEGEDDEANDKKSEELLAARSRIFAKLVQKNASRNILPVLVELRRVFEARRSPLIKPLMTYLKELVQENKGDGEAVRSNFPSLFTSYNADNDFKWLSLLSLLTPFLMTIWMPMSLSIIPCVHLPIHSSSLYALPFSPSPSPFLFFCLISFSVQIVNCGKRYCMILKSSMRPKNVLSKGNDAWNMNTNNVNSCFKAKVPLMLHPRFLMHHPTLQAPLLLLHHHLRHHLHHRHRHHCLLPHLPHLYFTVHLHCAPVMRHHEL